MSLWHDSIDERPGRLPVIRASSRDVVYEFRMQGGVMSSGIFTPAPNVRLSLRCDDAGGVFIRIAHGVRKGSKS